MSTPADLLQPLADPAAADDNVATAVQGFNDQAQAWPGPIEDYLWKVFNAVFDIAGATPPQRQEKLVDCLVRLRQTTATDKEGKPLKYESHGEVWKDMPSFGWYARELWNFDSTDPTATAEEHLKWDNWAAFLAQLTARSSKDGESPLDFSLFALWDLRTALEKDQDGEFSAASVRQATTWIRFAGEYLRELSAKGHRFPERMGIADGKYRECGWRGFNDDRWKAWGDELKVAQSKLEPDEGIREAIKLMDEL